MTNRNSAKGAAGGLPHLAKAALTSGPAVAWLTLFLLLPLAGIAGISFLSRGDYGQVQLPLTLENYKRLLGFGLFGFDPLYPVILLRSILLGFTTAVLCVLLGLPVAFFIAKSAPRFRTPALMLIVIPFWVNLLIRTYAWQILLGPGTWITNLASKCGMASNGALYPGNFAVVVGMVCDFLPFMILPLYASVEKLDWTLAEAAMDLGANRLQVFRHAVLPQISAGITAGFVLVLLPAIGQFVIPDLLGGSRTVLLGNIVQQQFGPSRDWPFGAAIAFVSLLLVFAGMWLFSRRAEEVVNAS